MITPQTITKITNLVISEMIYEAAMVGSSITKEDIVKTITNEPLGETAQYFNQGVLGGLQWYLNLIKDPDLLKTFSKTL